MSLTKNNTRLDTLTSVTVQDCLQAELMAGLKSADKYVNPKFFYDEKGSNLFARICDLAEYYLTRTETGILKRSAADIAALTGSDCILVEPGAGSCEKVRHLLPELRLQAYIPMDISKTFLQQATSQLSRQFPALKIMPVAADFSEDFEIPVSAPGSRRILFYPGSTIGNFTSTEALKFLHRMHDVVGKNGGLIIGVDLHKEREVLNAAYNDSQGVTAAFNLNVLSHINYLLDADFKLELFEHRAFYNEQEHRIEMHLISKVQQTVNCDGEQIHFAEGEGILTEYSYKYTVEGFAELAARAGFELQQSWQDDNNLFSVLFFQAH